MPPTYLPLSRFSWVLWGVNSALWEVRTRLLFLERLRPGAQSSRGPWDSPSWQIKTPCLHFCVLSFGGAGGLRPRPAWLPGLALPQGVLPLPPAFPD